jgi:hypothetical protein
MPSKLYSQSLLNMSIGIWWWLVSQRQGNGVAWSWRHDTNGGNMEIVSFKALISSMVFQLMKITLQ